MTPRATYHVYAADGFESAHRSLEAAKRAAKRGAGLRGVRYDVILCPAGGYTGQGRGNVVATYPS